jgi:hypothetical protein
VRVVAGNGGLLIEVNVAVPVVTFTTAPLTRSWSRTTRSTR